MKKIMSVLMVFCATLNGWSQIPQVLFYGYIEEGRFESEEVNSSSKKEKAPAKLSDVSIYVYSGDSLISTEKARESGFYASVLNSGIVYRIVFEKQGYFCKCFELDCRQLQYPSDEAAVKCPTDITLFKKVDDADLLNLCSIPFAKASFNMSHTNLTWDMEYTARIKEKFFDLAQPYYTAMK
jgi:hypothetical protein